jgi:DNA polymerase III delta prime subunit
VAAAFLGEVRALRHEVNIYRGQVLSVAQGDGHNPFSKSLSLKFIDTGALSRNDVVLPGGLLERIERHTIGFAAHTAQLRAAGRTLHRGLLFYGPPGTGKTHTVRYLSSAMPNRTTFVISGAAFGVLPSICGLARELAPAMVVLEDVDLVAQERSMVGAGENPLLFTLMNEMDGIGPDADVIFLLTTNRADLLEPALAARPGRIDLAVEIPAPDAACRARLIELYGRGMTMHLDNLDSVVSRTEGVSAAFIKEMLRRSALIAAMSTGAAEVGPLVVTSSHLDQALDEMLDSSDALTRSLLGATPPTAKQPIGTPSGPTLPHHIQAMLDASHVQQEPDR